MHYQYDPTIVIMAKYIDQILQQARFHTILWMEGFGLSHIETHSIRASTAMHLYLNNVAEATIMNIARWQSPTWLAKMTGSFEPCCAPSHCVILPSSNQQLNEYYIKWWHPIGPITGPALPPSQLKELWGASD
jgi:hypothetical protein